MGVGSINFLCRWNRTPLNALIISKVVSDIRGRRYKLVLLLIIITPSSGGERQFNLMENGVIHIAPLLSRMELGDLNRRQSTSKVAVVGMAVQVFQFSLDLAEMAFLDWVFPIGATVLVSVPPMPFAQSKMTIMPLRRNRLRFLIATFSTPLTDRNSIEKRRFPFRKEF